MSLNLQGLQQNNELLYVGFNQDQGCFACGTDNGFRIYNCDPFKETFRRDFSNGGIGIVEMLFRCNILALVGGGKSPRYQPNKVMLWDDHQSRCIGELSFRSEVKAVRLRRDKVIVVLEYKIYVYNFANLKLQHHIETVSNVKGLCALCPNARNCVLVCPGLHRGHLRVELYDLKKTTLIAAHETTLACMAVNMEGTRVATASEKGTLIRIFDTTNGQLLQELRRGADRADIYSIGFHPEGKWLCVSSDHGTIHVFALQCETDGVANNRSSLSLLRALLPKYFSSEWSFAQFRVKDVRTICAFGVDNQSLIVVSADGSFYKCSFDSEKGGDGAQQSYACFLTPPAAQESEDLLRTL